MNHTRIIGPNSQPTAPVPCRWIANNPTRIPSEIGTTRCERPGAATFNPSTAEVTEIAGVIMPSPKNRPAPKIPNVTRIAVRPTPRRWIRAASAITPPSPRLWARITKHAYLIDTTIKSAQKISETIP